MSTRNPSRSRDPRKPPLNRRGSLPAFFVPPSRQTTSGDGSNEDNGNSLAKLLAVGLAGCAVSTIATASVLMAWVRRMAPPKLHYVANERNKDLLRSIPLLFRTYVPNLLSWNAHAAGFFGYVKMPGSSKIVHSTEFVTMPDGGRVCLSWTSTPVDGQPVVLLLPGINNEASMPYVRHLMRHLEEEGMGPVAALDWRGLGLSQPLCGTTCTPRPYCGYGAPDIRAVLSHLRHKLPSSQLFAVGWSMGAGSLLRHMGEAGERCLLHAAMVVSPSIEVAQSVKHMRANHPWYLPIIILPLVHYLWKHRAALRTGPTPIEFWREIVPHILKTSGLDDHVYAPLWGLKDKEDYWRKSSAIHVLSTIAKPTLIVHSADDPICPASALPLEVMSSNPYLITAITRHGGHMGYTAGISPLKWTWTDRILVHFLRHLRKRASPSSADQHGTSGSASSGGSNDASKPTVPVFAVPSKL